MPIDIADPSRLPKDFSIFFCWQDHLDKKLHRFLIRDALNAAISKVQSELPDEIECELRQDSDTSGRAGAVDIADTILTKISSSAVVVGDVTPVLFDLSLQRWYPNPNVMIEIGYAARAIGWNRVICLFNEAACQTEHLPFDIRHRRATSYSCKNVSEKQQAAKQLEGVLVVSLRAVLEEIGRGEVEPSLGDAAMKHARDLRLLRQLMSTIHRPTLDVFIEKGLMHQLHDDCNFFFLGFEAVIRSSNLRFYDKKLQQLAVELYRVWSAAVHHGGYAFFPSYMGNTYVLKEHHLWNEHYEKTVKNMDIAYSKLQPALKAFLDHVHEKFPEIDMKDTDKNAWKNNLPYIAGTHFEKKPIKQSVRQTARRKRK